MRLSPRELDGLLVHQAGYVAQKRLARGCRLNHPEAVALLSCQVQEFARDGCSVAELMDKGRQLLGRWMVMDGVEEMIHDIEIEATFPDGTKLVTLSHPICTRYGNLELALYGSFLPIPKLEMFEKEERSGKDVDKKLLLSPPGSIFPSKGEKIEINKGRRRVALRVKSLCDRPIQVGSHFNFTEANKELVFDRTQAYGKRLNIPAGNAVRFEPGQSKVVTLVDIGGRRWHCMSSLPFTANEQSRPGFWPVWQPVARHVKSVIYSERAVPDPDFGQYQASSVTLAPTHTDPEATLRIVRGGNSLCDGPVEESRLPLVMERVRAKRFGHMEQVEVLEPSPCFMSRFLYAKTFGPTTGDKVRLGDTNLIVEVEKDFTIYGDECKFGGGKVCRESMGQSVQVSSKEALESVIINCLIIDAVQGIVKADVGIRDGKICGIGKAGNPDTMDGVTPGMTIGAATDAIAGEGLILTAGGIDSHVHFIAPQLAKEAVASGITTMIGGGTGPSTGSCTTTSSPGPGHIRFMIQSTDAFPLNFGFTGRGNASQSEGLCTELVEQVEAGAIGLKLHEDCGSTPAAIDTALRVADAHDVQILIHTDTLNESTCVEGTIEAFAGRTIHTYHSEGAGGGHAPDIITVCGIPNVLPSSTSPTRPYTVNTVDEHMDMLMICHFLDRNLKEDIAFAESRIRAETIAAEDILHDMGAISMMSSDSLAMGRIGEVITRTWQTADKMKTQRGSLPEEKGDNDNLRVKRFIAKYTINPAIAHGISHVTGSVEVARHVKSAIHSERAVPDPDFGHYHASSVTLAPTHTDLEAILRLNVARHQHNRGSNGSDRAPRQKPHTSDIEWLVILGNQVGKMADLVLWNPAFFGAKPHMVIKGGRIVWAAMGNPNASIPTSEPVTMRKMFGAYGKGVETTSCIFVSQLSVDRGIVQQYGVKKEIVPIRGVRNLGKKDMVLNDYLPKIKVNPETFRVYVKDSVGNKEEWVNLICDPAQRIPLAQRYFLF